MVSGNWAPQEAFSFMVPFLTSLVVSWGTHKPASHNTAMADSIRRPPFFFLPPSCVRLLRWKTNNLSIHVWWSVYTLMTMFVSCVLQKHSTINELLLVISFACLCPRRQSTDYILHELVCPQKKSVISSGMAWDQASGSWAICDSGAPCAANSCCNLLFSSSIKAGNGSFEKKMSHMYISTWTRGERNLKGYPCAKCFALGMGLQKMLDLQIITDQSFMNHLQ